MFQTSAQTYTLETWYAGEISDLSLRWYNEEKEFDGQDQRVIGGFDGVVSGLLSGLNIDIRLSQFVSEIDYSGVSGVTVKITDGTSLTSDYVVCTIPLGVLKSGKVKFIPDLPAAKQRAMDHLKMGVLNQLYLEFPFVFWD